jgi:hypothetical protein
MSLAGLPIAVNQRLALGGGHRQRALEQLAMLGGSLSVPAKVSPDAPPPLVAPERVAECRSELTAAAAAFTTALSARLLRNDTVERVRQPVVVERDGHLFERLRLHALRTSEHNRATRPGLTGHDLFLLSVAAVRAAAVNRSSIVRWRGRIVFRRIVSTRREGLRPKCDNIRLQCSFDRSVVTEP